LNRVHCQLASAGEQCHQAVARDDQGELRRVEEQIDRAAAKLWRITDEELAAIQRALAESRPKRGHGKRAAGEDEDGE
jgi:hypothetical protein